MLNVAVPPEYRRVVVIKRIYLLYQIYDGPNITVFDGRNIFPISVMSFYLLVELRPEFTFIV